VGLGRHLAAEQMGWGEWVPRGWAAKEADVFDVFRFAWFAVRTFFGLILL
jgi:hypothetical protein